MKNLLKAILETLLAFMGGTLDEEAQKINDLFLMKTTVR